MKRQRTGECFNSGSRRKMQGDGRQHWELVRNPYTWKVCCTCTFWKCVFLCLERLLEGTVPVAFSWERAAGSTREVSFWKGPAETQGLTGGCITVQCLTLPGMARRGSYVWSERVGKSLWHRASHHLQTLPKWGGKPTSCEWRRLVFRVTKACRSAWNSGSTGERHSPGTFLWGSEDIYQL